MAMGMNFPSPTVRNNQTNHLSVVRIVFTLTQNLIAYQVTITGQMRVI